MRSTLPVFLPEISTRQAARARNRLRGTVAGALALVLATSTLVLTGGVLPAQAAGQPVVIDGFDGSRLGTRTVTTLPLPNTATTSPGTFAETGGLGTVRATGAGNAQGGVRLTYDIPQTDLTSGGSNTQLFFEFTSIARLPVVNTWDTAMNVTALITDNRGVTGSYNTGISNTGAFDLVLNFACAGGPCFSPQPDFTKVRKVSIEMLYPTSHDSSGASLTAVLDIIRTTPTGGASPSAPQASVTTATDTLVAAGTPTVDFTVGFSADGAGVASPGFDASDLTLTGTAPGAKTIVSITPSGSGHVVTVGPLTGSGTVKLGVKPGAITDTWGQRSLAASSPTVTFTKAVAPVFTSGGSGSMRAGTASAISLAASGTPAPTFTALTALPVGLALSPAGVLAGTPAAGTGGVHQLTFRATNVAGSVDTAYTLTIAEAPTVTISGSAAFAVGSAGSIALTVGGYPKPTVALSSGTLPGGLTLSPEGVLSGTPTAGSEGITTVTAEATNVNGVSSLSLPITVSRFPVITSVPAATFRVGAAGSFVATASGFPAAAFTTTGTLPTGVSLSSAGILSGTPAAGTGGSYPVSLKATNTMGSTVQAFLLTVEQAPSITGPAILTTGVGDTLPAPGPGAFTLAGHGYPKPTFSVAAAHPLPAGLSLVDNGDGTATIVGTPAAGTGGAHTATVVASSSVPGLAPASFVVTIHVASDPAITSADSVTLPLGVAASFQATATGYPAPVFTAGTIAPGLSIDATGLITGTPTALGDVEVQLSATNSRRTVVQDLTISVTAAPAITSASAVTFTAGTAATFAITASGYPAAAITRTAGTLPAGLTLLDNGGGAASLAGTPAAGSGGEYRITIRAASGLGSDTQDLEITVLEAPTVHAGPSATGVFPITGATSLSLIDRGYPAPTFAVTAGALPSGLSLSTAGTISGTPAVGAGGVHSVTVRASNSSGNATRTVSLVVSETAAFTSAASGVAEVGTAVSLPITTIGHPVSAITITAGSLPAGLTLVDNGDGSASIQGTPDTGTGGDHTITIGAWQPAPGLLPSPLAPATPTVEQLFTLSVAEAPSITVPSLLALTAGAAHSTVVRTGGFPLPALTVTGGLPAGLSFVDAGDGTATLAGTPTAASVGTYPVTVTATNPHGTTSAAITIRVGAAPVAPTPTLPAGDAGSSPATGGIPIAGSPASGSEAVEATPPVDVSFTAATPDQQRTGDELGDIPTLAVEDPVTGAGEEGESGGIAPGMLFVVIVLSVLLGGGLVTVLVLRARVRA